MISEKVIISVSTGTTEKRIFRLLGSLSKFEATHYFIFDFGFLGALRDLCAEN